MAVARTMRLKHLLFTTSMIRARRFANEKGWPKTQWKMIKNPRQLKTFHMFPIQNCTIHVLGNSPVIGSPEFIRLLAEKQ